MKANELMIGDWVLINDTPRKIQSVNGVDDEIMADDELYTLAEDRYHSEDKVTGIPLTPEILEKNGNELSIGPSGLYQGAISGVNCHIEFNIIKYVHELQHALSLCGIEKNITI